jgi:hypothetical protein
VGGFEQAGAGGLNMTTTTFFSFTPGKTRRTSFTAPNLAFRMIFKPAIYLHKVQSTVLKGRS